MAAILWNYVSRLFFAIATQLQYDAEPGRMARLGRAPENHFVKPQRIFSHLAFALFLLLSQQLGIAHAISHFSSDRVSRSTHEKPLPAEMQCSQCLAFAAIGSALNGASATCAAVVPIGWRPIAPPVAKRLPSVLHAYHSRAPPVTL